jgi:hypothetical protein
VGLIDADHCRKIAKIIARTDEDIIGKAQSMLDPKRYFRGIEPVRSNMPICLSLQIRSNISIPVRACVVPTRSAGSVAARIEKLQPTKNPIGRVLKWQSPIHIDPMNLVLSNLT